MFNEKYFAQKIFAGTILKLFPIIGNNCRLYYYIILQFVGYWKQCYITLYSFMMLKFLQIAEGEESSLSYEEDFVELPIKTELNVEESSEETKDNEFYDEEATQNLCGIKVV